MDSCTVTGTNNDSWPEDPLTDPGTISGTTLAGCSASSDCSYGYACLNNICTQGKSSAPIQGQTIYTISCILSVDGSTYTRSAVVNMLPVFCEPGTTGCG